MDVDLPEDEALTIVAEGIDGWLTSMGEETGGKVAQKLLLVIGLWAVKHDREQAVSTFKDCIHITDEGKEAGLVPEVVSGAELRQQSSG
jgi:hypothetical protein